ncbi:MAG: Fe(2+) transporter permease subunit FeoB [Wenzhouxiangellaceae bacterium]|nr:Fe(2+) transporter permease subunit FeoB [Wenzhouxiangellaceae bacterium]
MSACHGRPGSGLRGNGPVIALAGNPNCGKTTLFNALTGIRQHTGNWPGVTVERREGRFPLETAAGRLVDLPGVHSLAVAAASLDESLARDYLAGGEVDCVVNVLDAACLERGLYLTVQLLELGIPVVVALNRMDLAGQRGIDIDTEALALALGCPVVPVVARRRQGLERLRAAVSTAIREGCGPPVAGPRYAPEIEQAVGDLAGRTGTTDLRAARRNALEWLQAPPAPGTLPPESAALADHWRERIERGTGEPMDLLVADARYQFAHDVALGVQGAARLGRHHSDRIDRLVVHRWLGVPIFLGVIYLLFTLTINFGGAFIDFFDLAAGAIFVDAPARALDAAGAPEWLKVLVADGAGGGIQVVATFIPIIGVLYLLLSLLEDSGYMARAAFVMDRSLRAIGLPGKAFVPLIIGFGCNVPAITATRTLESHRERILTVLMTPFMSCGARLSVYALFAAAFFPHNGANIVFALYLVGIGAALFTAWILKNSLLAGEPDDFVMEMPAYQWPGLRDLLLSTWSKLRGFIADAGKLIVAMVVVLNVLGSVGTDGSFGHENSRDSVLAATARAVTPAFAPMGLERDNWPATVGILTGVLAKEVVVGTLDSLYSTLDAGPAPNAPGPGDDELALLPALREALATIPPGLADAARGLLDPLGLGILADSASRDRAAAAQAVDVATFGAMAERFDGRTGAFAYLLFILLYFPCVAATSAVRREAGGRWALFAVCWSTGLAWSVATLFYQTVTFVRHPAPSAIWITGLAGLGALFVAATRMAAQRRALGVPA